MRSLVASFSIGISFLLLAGCGTTGPKLDTSRPAEKVPAPQMPQMNPPGGSENIYVSCDGADANPGTEAAPVASLAVARDIVRKRIAAGGATNITVFIRSGTYELKEPLVFGPEDSGSETLSITYSAYPGEKVVISGGSKLTGWTQGSNGLWSVALREVAEGKWYFRSLFVENKRAVRARSPNLDAKEAYYRVTGSNLSDDLSRWEMQLSPGLVAHFSNETDAEVCVFGNWEITRKRIAGIDSTSGTITLLPPHLKGHPNLHPRPGMAAYLENSRSFLDQPGEWFLDRASGVLTYWPRPDEDLTRAVVVAPRLATLLSAEGTTGNPIRNLHFCNLSFSHTDWNIPSNGYAGIQACFFQSKNPWTEGNEDANQPPAAVLLQNARDCSIMNGEISHIGGNAARILGCGTGNHLEGNRICDVGANGIGVGNGHHERIYAECAGNYIVNNEISVCGCIFYGAVGIWVGLTKGTVVAHNSIHDLPYSGISLGWWWNSMPTCCAANTIEANHIYDVLKMLSDGGGIYTLGFQPGTVLRKNLIHDIMRNPVTAVGAANNGFFIDAGSKSLLFEDNVVFKTSGAPVRFNDNEPNGHTFRDNFFGEYNFGKGKVGNYALDVGGDHFWDEVHSPALDPQLFTLSSWIRPVAFASGKDPSAWLLCKNGDEMTDGHYSLLISRQNVGAYMNIGGGRENLYSAWSHDNPIHAGEWSHVAMTYDGTDLKVYCNGRLAGVSTVNAQRTAGAGFLRIGKRSDGYAQSFSGFMDDVRLYNRAMSAGEINDYYSRSSADREQGTTTTPQTSGPEPANSVALTTESGLAFHMDFTAMYDKIEAIKANAGPEEPYRSRFEGRPEPAKGAPASAHNRSVPVSERDRPLAKTESKDGWFMRTLKFIFWILLGG